jgi:hypothetical protein
MHSPKLFGGRMKGSWNIVLTGFTLAGRCVGLNCALFYMFRIDSFGDSQ